MLNKASVRETIYRASEFPETVEHKLVVFVSVDSSCVDAKKKSPRGRWEGNANHRTPKSDAEIGAHALTSSWFASAIMTNQLDKPSPSGI